MLTKELNRFGSKHNLSLRLTKTAEFFNETNIICHTIKQIHLNCEKVDLIKDLKRCTCNCGDCSSVFVVGTEATFNQTSSVDVVKVFRSSADPKHLDSKSSIQLFKVQKKNSRDCSKEIRIDPRQNNFSPFKMTCQNYDEKSKTISEL